MPGFRPAGFSDDEDSDDYNYSYDRNGDTEIVNGNDPQEVGDTGPWSHPRCLSPTTQDSVTAACNDSYAFLKLIQADNVAAVREVLKVSNKLVNQNFGTSSAFMMAGGSRPIFVACSMGLPDMVSLLLEFGADLSPDSSDLLTPLMAVCSASPTHGGRDKDDFEFKLKECARLLIEAGKVDVSAKQSQKLTALMFAAKQGYDSLVELLISHGAALDVVESQNWTALTFAVDAEFGNVARRLLEAGANPDIANLDGQLPFDLAEAKRNTKLSSIIKSFAHRAQLLRIEKGDSTESGQLLKKFSELDNILLGLDAAEYIPLFNKHGLNLETFLELNELDLEKIGVDKVGIRKKISQAIVDIHKKEWGKSSLAKILPKDKQNGIYLTCPDAVLQLANMSQHFKFLSANLQFLKRHLKEKPEMLLIGKDVADSSHLINRVREARLNLASTSKQLKDVDEELARACRKLSIELNPVDRISDNVVTSKRRRFVVTLASSVLLISASVVIVYVASKRGGKS